MSSVPQLTQMDNLAFLITRLPLIAPSDTQVGNGPGVIGCSRKYGLVGGQTCCLVAQSVLQ